MAAGERERQGPERGSPKAPYEGTLGRTRTEPVQVWMPDGTIRALSVYVGVDADADPALGTLARAGTLHHIADGVELAIPFVYHARSASLLLLVVPEGLRHRALALRAEQLALIASDAGHAVPDYVRDAELVIGIRGLSDRLSGGEPAAKLQSVTLDGVEDGRALLSRERDLMRRERLIRTREHALRVAERARGGGYRSLPQGVEDNEIEEVDDTLGAGYERALVDPSAEFDMDGPVYVEGAPDNDEEAPDTEGPVEAEDSSEFDTDEVTEAEPVDALDDVEDVDDVEDIEADDAVDDDLDEALLQVAPAAFADDSEAELWLTEHDGRVWLFVRHRPSPPRDVSQLELLLQLDPGAEISVALLTLVFDVNGSPEVRRGAVDPNDPAQVRALSLLSEHFEVELVSVAGPHDFEPWAVLSAAREGNARAVLSRLTRLAEHDPERLRSIRDALLRAPPPWRDLSHPFQPEPNGPLAQTATEAAVQLDELAAWLSPERRDRLRLLWSVPDELVDEHTTRCLGSALDWGLSLSEPLAARALELGLAQDQRALLERRILGLCRTSRAPDDAGLEASVLRAQWTETLEQAARLGVSLTSEAFELAKEHAGERAVMHAAGLSDERSEALDAVRARAISSAEVDVLALQELLERGPYRDLVAGCRALTRVSVEDAARLFAKVAARNDPAAVDALLSLLGASEQARIRVGAALSLAQRRAVHAIDEIVANLVREPTPTWRLFALALGRYGAGSFRAAIRAMLAHKVDSERTALVFALLCCHGARAQVRARARSADASDAKLAERALSLAADCKSDELLLMALEAGGDLTVFCGIFDGTSAAASV